MIPRGRRTEKFNIKINEKGLKRLAKEDMKIFIPKFCNRQPVNRPFKRLGEVKYMYPSSQQRHDCSSCIILYAYYTINLSGCSYWKNYAYRVLLNHPDKKRKIISTPM